MYLCSWIYNFLVSFGLDKLSIVFVLLQNKVNLSEQLPNYLGCEVKIVTTQCCIVEAENLANISKCLSKLVFIVANSLIKVLIFIYII